MVVGLRYPVEGPTVEETEHIMILDDYFIIENISQDETLEIVVPAKMRLRPTAVKPQGQITKVSYTAVNICDVPAFRTFYRSVVGKSIKAHFEGYTYRGYMSEVIYGEFDVSFVMTEQGVRLEQNPIDPFYGRRHGPE